MRWFLFLVPLICFALEVITDPYDEVRYGDIEVYHYNKCYCPEDEENEDETELPETPFDLDKFLLKI